MRILIAIDSFKGSISSAEAAQAAFVGVRRVFPDADCALFPIADGGEGTVEALAALPGAVRRRVTVSGPRRRPVCSDYAVLADGTAVIEMASAAGLPLLSANERDPMVTTTYGVGEMIADALNYGCRRFVIGIGGSATNDVGVGMLQALGFVFTDGEGRTVRDGALAVRDIRNISVGKAHRALQESEFFIACDVTNPLCGERGCSKVFAPQKGARAEDLEIMDAWLCDYASIVKSTFPEADPNAAGAGAAGGLGFAFSAFLNAKMQSGIDLVLETIGMEEALRNADLVITGEGRLDAQTAMGKAPVGVAKLAKRYGKPVIAFCGCATSDARVCNEHGIDAFFPIVRGACTLEEAMNPENAKKNLADTAEQVMRAMATLALR